MFLSLIIFFLLLVILYFLSRKIIKNLYLFFLALTKNKNTALDCLSFFILPGTVIHELSHMLVAELLLVKTGEFSFRPEIEDNQVKVGKLKIASTDPIRRTIIGLAPLIIGLSIIGTTFHFYLLPSICPPPGWRLLGTKSTLLETGNLGLSKLLCFFHPGGVFTEQFNNLTIEQFLIIFALCYLIFNISITMFSSKKDLETAIFPVALFVILTLFLWLAGFKLTFPKYFLEVFVGLFMALNKALVFVCFLDFVGLLGIKTLIAFSRCVLSNSHPV